jgi:ABC-2 type transport system permease protein
VTTAVTTADAASNTSSPSVFRAAVFLFWLTLKRQFFSRQTLVNVGLLTICGLIVAAWAQRSNRTVNGFADFMLLPTYIGFLMPILAVSYGSSTIGGEREDQSLIYLLVTPIPRGVIYVVKALAAGALVLSWSASALLLLCFLAGPVGEKTLPVYWQAAVLGSLLYASVFLFLGAMFRHGTILSLAYWFFLEVLFVQMPGTVKRVTVAYYIRCVIFDAGKEFRFGPRTPADQELFGAIPGNTAALVMIAAIVMITVIGATLFSRREYTELG